MACAVFILFAVLGVLIISLRLWLLESRPSDYVAIDALLATRGLRPVTVIRQDDYWLYWLRGHLSLSNCARIYVVLGEAPGGSRRELHVAFDTWPLGTVGGDVLLEREVPDRPTDKPPAVGAPTAVAAFLSQREAIERAKRE
jgi:hypothetical protein